MQHMLCLGYLSPDSVPAFSCCQNKQMTVT